VPSCCSATPTDQSFVGAISSWLQPLTFAAILVPFKCLQCELQSRDQQLLQVLQSEQDSCQLRTQLETQLEQQTARLLKAQQELQQVQLMWQQECKHTATATASATAAW
jgi:hypothetical protein